MNKAPAFQFYVKDHAADPQLSACSLAARGFHIVVLTAGWENDRSGQVSGTLEQLARLARCTPAEAQAAIDDLRLTGADDIEELNGIITIKNRRMNREYLERKANNDRQKRFQEKKKAENPPQEKRGDNGKVTTLSSSSTPSTTTPVLENKGSTEELFPSSGDEGRSDELLHDPGLGSQRNGRAKPKSLPADFEQFWGLYPRKVSKQDAAKVWDKLNPDQFLLAEILAAAKNQAVAWQAEGRESRHIMHPDRWLRGQHWTDQIESSVPRNGNQRRSWDNPPEYGTPEWDDYVEQTSGITLKSEADMLADGEAERRADQRRNALMGQPAESVS